MCGEAGGQPTGVSHRLKELVRIFGRERVVIDVQRHRRREHEAESETLLAVAESAGLMAVATNGVRHAKAGGRLLLDALTCIREKRTLATAGRLMSQNAERHLKSPKQMEALFRDRSDLIRNTQALAERLVFTLDDLGPTSSRTTRCRRGRRSSRTCAR